MKAPLIARHSHGAAKGTIEESEFIRAPVSRVFGAITTAGLLDEWGAGPARFQARAGGRYFFWDGEMEGMVVDIQPPHRLVITLREREWKNDWRDSLVMFTLTEERGGTRLILRHSGFSDRRAFERHREGWAEYYLGPLKAFCEERYRV
jgi:uncharacterized protein YndB with AHSA1/START domain